MDKFVYYSIGSKFHVGFMPNKFQPTGYNNYTKIGEVSYSNTKLPNVVIAEIVKHKLNSDEAYELILYYGNCIFVSIVYILSCFGYEDRNRAIFRCIRKNNANFIISLLEHFDVYWREVWHYNTLAINKACKYGNIKLLKYFLVTKKYKISKHVFLGYACMNLRALCFGNTPRHMKMLGSVFDIFELDHEDITNRFEFDNIREEYPIMKFIAIPLVYKKRVKELEFLMDKSILTRDNCGVIFVRAYMSVKPTVVKLTLERAKFYISEDIPFLLYNMGFRKTRNPSLRVIYNLYPELVKTIIADIHARTIVKCSNPYQQIFYEQILGAMDFLNLTSRDVFNLELLVKLKDNSEHIRQTVIIKIRLINLLKKYKFDIDDLKLPKERNKQLIELFEMLQIANSDSYRYRDQD